MVRVTLTEPMVNAIGAALDARSKSLVAKLVKHKNEPPSRDRDFAVECLEDAIRDGIAARLTIAAAVEEPEYPESMTFADLSADPSAVWHYELDR